MVRQRISQKQIDELLTILLALYQTEEDQNIRRVAKSLFTLLSQQRFSAEGNKTIKF
jgi:hypothetical protein